MDRILMGHNPLFGVDHLSQDRGNEKELQFRDQQRIKEVLGWGHALGVNGLMVSTHPRAADVVEVLTSDPKLSEISVYPLLPYIAKYVRQANEKGLANVLLDVLRRAEGQRKISMVLNGARVLVGKDIEKAIRLLVDIEFLMFRDCRLGAIFIHDALVDLAIGLNAESALAVFKQHVEQTYGVPAGFITKNVVRFRECADRLGWSDYLVMASLNKAGFYVNPGLEEAVQAVERPGMQFIAMNTLASGATKPREAYKFLSEVRGVDSVVVGMSKKHHIEETVGAINDLMWQDAGVQS
jgi:hypothetical protein